MGNQQKFPKVIKVVYTDGRPAEMQVLNNQDELDTMISTVTSPNSEAVSYSLFDFIERRQLTRQWLEVPHE